MADILRIKRRLAAGGAGTPASLANAELAYNEASHTLYYGEGTGGSGGTATSVVPIAGPGAFLPLNGGTINTSLGSWSSSNYGKQLLVTGSGNNPTIGFTDNTGANLIGITNAAGVLRIADMPAYANSTTAPVNLLSLDGAGSTSHTPWTFASTTTQTGAATFSSTVTLALDPALPLQAVTKQYADRQVATAATIAALRASTSATLPVSDVQVRSYAGTGTKGGGRFLYVSTDTTTADNGGTIIVDASSRRWYRDDWQNNPVNVLWFGAIGDGVANDTAAIQAAIATGQPVYIPPGVYLVRDAITCATPGQLIQGAGRQHSVILANTTFNMSAAGVFVLTSGEPGAYLKSFKIRFVQPDTAVRASLTTYPAAVMASTQPRFVLEEMSITNATVAVNMGGNSGGAYIRDLQASFYTFGIYIDGCVDTVRISELHFAGFEMTANQLSIAQSTGTTCIASGRCDDLKLMRCLFLFYLDLNLFAGASGYTFGSAIDCAFDGYNGIQQQSGGRFEVTGSYFTATAAGFKAATITNGILYISNSWFGQGNSGASFIDVLGSSGNTGRIVLTGCSFDTSSADVTGVVVNGTGGGIAEAIISSCFFLRTANIAYVQPCVSVGANISSFLSMSNCRANDKGAGAGIFINCASDNQHRIIGNNSPNWTNTFPGVQAAGVYQFN